MNRSSTAIWQGSGKEGRGSITSQSRALNNASYSWSTRFAEEKGTNPEELIAAAHAGCFTMKLSFFIGDAGYTPEEITTTSTVTIEGGTIRESHLVVNGKIPGMSQNPFLDCAERAKKECPVSRALNIKITMEAHMESLMKA
jgi:osmotically inducible protein OsmC